jgi:DNA-binding MarR family transcriptional regulator
MAYRQTSLFAYEQAKDNLGEKQRQVLSAIRQIGKCTDKHIAAFLGWPINRVTPRRNELVESGHVIECGVVKNEYNRPVTLWSAWDMNNA